MRNNPTSRPLNLNLHPTLPTSTPLNHHRMNRYMLAGQLSNYHGLAVCPVYLSWWGTHAATQ